MMICIISMISFLLFVTIDDVSYDDLLHLYGSVFVGLAIDDMSYDDSHHLYSSAFVVRDDR